MGERDPERIYDCVLGDLQGTVARDIKNSYLADVITKIVIRHPNSRIDELLPWAYAGEQSLKNVT